MNILSWRPTIYKKRKIYWLSYSFNYAVVMPYGLSNSPSIFQNFMHEIFRDMINRFVLIYIDDILIYSPTIEEHRRHVTQVLQRLRQHHLYLKTEKCEFHKSTIHFLGYIVTPAGVQMDQRKVEAVMNWPQPTTIKEMQRFLGFANFYRRFIAHYSQQASTSYLSPPAEDQVSHLNRGGSSGIHSTQIGLLHRPGSVTSRPQHPFCGRGGCSDPGSGCGPIPMEGWTSRAPSVCLLLEETVPGWAELRRG